MKHSRGFSAIELIVIASIVLCLIGVSIGQYVEYIQYYPVAGDMMATGAQYGSDSLIAELYADSILLYMPFDGTGDSLTDYSGNHMRGTSKEASSAYGIFQNDTAKSGDGALKLNYAAGTDSGYLIIPDVLHHLRNTIEGTISAWVNTGGLVTDTITIFSASDSAELEKIALQITPSGNVLAILMDSTGQGTGKIHWACSSSAAIDTTGWNLVTLTHNNTTPLIYVNGSLDTAQFIVSTSKTSWFDSLTMLDEAFIGIEAYDSLGHIHPFAGWLDELIIEKEAWTAAEIAAYCAAPGTYNTSHASTTENVSGWLYFAQFDPGYASMRRARTVQDMYGFFVSGFRAKDTAGTDPNIRWLIQGKDTADVNTWTDISDTGYAPTTIGINTFIMDTLKGQILNSIIGVIPAQFRMKVIADSPNVAVVKPSGYTHIDTRFKTTE